MLFLMAHSLGENSRVSDIHRVYRLKDAISEFPEGEPQRLANRLLQRCIITPQWLRQGDGVKFLAHAMVRAILTWGER